MRDMHLMHLGKHLGHAGKENWFIPLDTTLTQSQKRKESERIRKEPSEPDRESSRESFLFYIFSLPQTTSSSPSLFALFSLCSCKQEYSKALSKESIIFQIPSQIDV